MFYNANNFALIRLPSVNVRSDTKQSGWIDFLFAYRQMPSEGKIKLEQELRVQMIREELRRKVGGTNKSLLCGVIVVAAKAVSRFGFRIGRRSEAPFGGE